jgi:hypothetical protein
MAQDARIPPDITVHGTLAAAWTLNSAMGRDRQYQEWEATWPSMADVQQSVPFMWPKHYQDRLPRGARGLLLTISQVCNHKLTGIALLQNQRTKYDVDWAKLKEAILSAGDTEKNFKYNWMLVNSRCYYWKYAKSRKPESGKTPLVDECMALCPYADYFNHSSEGVCNNLDLEMSPPNHRVCSVRSLRPRGNVPFLVTVTTVSSFGYCLLILCAEYLKSLAKKL